MFIRNYIIGYGFDLINRSIFYTKIGIFLTIFVMKCLQLSLYDTSKHLLFTTLPILGRDLFLTCDEKKRKNPCIYTS